MKNLEITQIIPQIERLKCFNILSVIRMKFNIYARIAELRAIVQGNAEQNSILFTQNRNPFTAAINSR